MNIKNTLINLAIVLILALGYHLIGGYITANYDAMSFFIFLHIWAILVGIYFGRTHVKELIGGGKFGINKGYIVVPLIYILSYTPLLGSVSFLFTSSEITLVAVIACYNLVMSVRRNPPEPEIVPAKFDREKGLEI